MEKTLLLIFILLSTKCVLGQNSKKESTDFYRQISKLDTNEIKSGKHLDVAREYTIERFVSYYIEHGEIQNTKKYGTLIIQELYSDSSFRYYGRKYYYGLIDFFKVKISDVLNINLKNIKGTEIRSNFIDQIVPEIDKIKVAKKEKSCVSLYSNPQFIYEYKKETKGILITYKWKISCDFLYKIINKTYVASYHIETMTFNQIK